eukprot:COSAG01_NODE_17420_length_1152_cov_9.816714_2_plen_121_part_00
MERSIRGKSVGVVRSLLQERYARHPISTCLRGVKCLQAGVALPPLTSEASVTAFLGKLRRFDPREALTRFGPFATLSNATRQAINRLKILEYGRYHRLPVFRWRWTTALSTPVPKALTIG